MDEVEAAAEAAGRVSFRHAFVLPAWRPWVRVPSPKQRSRLVLICRPESLSLQAKPEPLPLAIAGIGDHER